MWFGKVLSSPLPGEQVILSLRRHWITFIIDAFKYLLLIIFPAVIWWVLVNYLPDRFEEIFNSGLTEMLIKLGISIYYMGVWVFFWTVWVDYYLDVWIVTNERIISVEQKGLFNRSRNELRLGRVQDVTSEVKGMLATILHYGNVTIETAGMEQNSIFRNVPNAYGVAEQIIKISRNWRETHHDNGDSGSGT